MNKLKRISRKELAAIIGVSENSLRKILYDYKCSFICNRPGRQHLLNLNEVAEAIVKLHHLFDTPCPADVLKQAKDIFYNNDQSWEETF